MVSVSNLILITLLVAVILLVYGVIRNSTDQGGKVRPETSTTNSEPKGYGWLWWIVGILLVIASLLTFNPDWEYFFATGDFAPYNVTTY